MKHYLQYFKIFISIFIITSVVSGCGKSASENDSYFISDWSDESIDRPWAGSDYWLNPLQAWRQKEGQLSCEVSGGDRNVVLLTREINDSKGSFEMSISYKVIEPDSKIADKEESQDQNNTDGNIPEGLNDVGWIGFQLGLRGQFNDYRDDAIKGRGICAGMTTTGQLFIGDLSNLTQTKRASPTQGELRITATPNQDSTYQLTLLSLDESGFEQASYSSPVHASWLPGQMALTCSQSIPDTLNWAATRPKYNDLKGLNRRVGGRTNFAFLSWEVSGDKITNRDERAYGPILWTQHTLSDNIMKMSVQFAPIGNGPKEVVLFIDDEQAQQSIIDDAGRNALFRITDWNDDIDHTYSVKYKSATGTEHTYDGIIKQNPKSGQLTLASLSCVDDRGFPHQDLVDNVAAHQPDLLSFHGDQLYERVAGYGVERNSILDYQRKWYIFGWSFRELMRNTPTIIIPDDHDVFHGNLWGEGGKAADVTLGYGYDSQDSGGYKEPPEFVKMVHRTQTGHLPDPYDDTPVLQDISVYYTNMNYGGVSLAILGDRQWKSAPKPLLPKAEIENGWPQNKSWDAKSEAYHAKAELLGPRQEDFLEEWVSEWAADIEFKAVISQSPFCNVATLPAHIYHDKYVPTLPRYRKGQYPDDDRPVADFDSNGWPQNKRDIAVKTIRKAFALHIAGDQHLGSTGQYGADEYGDSGYWVSSPAVANLWPRRWFPAQTARSGKNAEDTRRYTGDYEDGFGNKITVKGIANPYDIDREPAMVFDKAPGYSIIRFDKDTRTMNIEVWPRWASPDNDAPDNQPYEDWPIVIQQQDNYGKKIAGYLHAIEVDGSELIQIFREDTNELVYCIRPKAGAFSPKVFDASGSYTIKVIEGGRVVRERKQLKAEKKSLIVE